MFKKVIYQITRCRGRLLLCNKFYGINELLFAITPASLQIFPIIVNVVNIICPAKLY